MAEDAVDAAIKSGKLNPLSRCVTNNLRIVGGEGWDPAHFTVIAQQYTRMKKAHDGKTVPGVMDTVAAKHLSHSYGIMAERVAAIAQVGFCHCILVLNCIWTAQEILVLFIVYFMLSCQFCHIDLLDLEHQAQPIGHL